MSAGTDAADTIVLGSCLYLPKIGSLIDRTGNIVFLRPQSSQVLRLLTDRFGEVVTKDDLIAEVWPDISVTDDSLTQCIADIRRAIGDRSRQIVRTLSKRGYMIGRPVPAPARDAERRHWIVPPPCDCPICPLRRETAPG